MRLKIIICGIVFIACARDSIHEEQKQIRSIRQSFNRSIAIHDSTHLSDFFTQDYTVISSRSHEAHGIPEEIQMLANEYRTKPDVNYIRTPDQIDVNPEWNMAAESGHWVGTWSDSTGKVIISGSYYAKWHKLNGKWKIRSEVFTPLHCEGSKYCEQAPELK